MAKASLVLGLSGRGLKDLDLFSKSDPYVVLSRQAAPGGTWVAVRTSETINNNLNPDWKEFLIPEAELGTGPNDDIQLEVFDDDGKAGKDRTDQSIGFLKTRASRLVQGQTLTLHCRKKGKEVGRIMVRILKRNPGAQAATQGAYPAPAGYPAPAAPPGGYPAPQGCYTASQGSYPAPAAPQGGYPVSQGSYPAPAAPQGGYTAPQGGYPAPQAGYPAPQAGYPAPQEGYPAPQGGYPAPAGYPATQGDYPAPQGGYPAPSGGYPAPQGGYPVPAGYPAPQGDYPAPAGGFAMGPVPGAVPGGYPGAPYTPGLPTTQGIYPAVPPAASAALPYPVQTGAGMVHHAPHHGAPGAPGAYPQAGKPEGRTGLIGQMQGVLAPGMVQGVLPPGQGGGFRLP